MAFYFEITKHIPFLTRKIQKKGFVLLFNIREYFLSVKISSSNMRNCLFSSI
jgi:hypothetical protein